MRQISEAQKATMAEAVMYRTLYATEDEIVEEVVLARNPGTREVEWSARETGRTWPISATGARAAADSVAPIDVGRSGDPIPSLGMVG